MRWSLPARRHVLEPRPNSGRRSTSCWWAAWRSIRPAWHDSREELLAFLQLRWRLYDGYGRRAFENQRTHEVAAAGFQLAERQRRLAGELAEAMARLAMLARRQPVLATANDAALLTYRLYRQQFGIDERSLLDLVDARQELLARSEEAVSGEIDRLRAAYSLAFAMGELRLWLTEPLPAQQSSADWPGVATTSGLMPLQLASVAGLTPMPVEGVPVSAAVAVAVAARGQPGAIVRTTAELSIAPPVAGKLGAGRGLAEMAQELISDNN